MGAGRGRVGGEEERGEWDAYGVRYIETEGDWGGRLVSVAPYHCSDCYALLLMTYYSLLTTHNVLLTTYCSPLTAHRSLLTIHDLLCSLLPAACHYSLHPSEPSCCRQRSR